MVVWNDDADFLEAMLVTGVEYCLPDFRQQPGIGYGLGQSHADMAKLMNSVH